MADTQKSLKNQYWWLKPYHFKKGNNANPGGRPKGAKSLKTYAKEYFERLSDEEKLKFLNTIDRELIWKMAEGNPSNELTGKDGTPLVLQISQEIAEKHAITSNPENSSQGLTQI